MTTKTPETDPYLGRQFVVVKSNGSFPRDFTIIGMTDWCYRIKNDVEEYVISKVAIGSYLASGQIQFTLTDDDIPF